MDADGFLFAATGSVAFVGFFPGGLFDGVESIGAGEVAAARGDVALVADGDDRGIVKVEETPGDGLMAGGAVDLLEGGEVTVAAASVVVEPAGGQEESRGEAIGNFLAEWEVVDIAPFTELIGDTMSEDFSEFVRDGPLEAFGTVVGTDQDHRLVSESLLAGSAELTDVGGEGDTESLGDADGIDGRGDGASLNEEVVNDFVEDGEPGRSGAHDGVVV